MYFLDEANLQKYSYILYTDIKSLDAEYLFDLGVIFRLHNDGSMSDALYFRWLEKLAILYKTKSEALIKEAEEKL